MKLGVFTTALAKYNLTDALEHCHRLGLKYVEIGTGGHFPKNHCDPAVLLSNEKALDMFRETLDRFGITVSAFAMHGEPLNPDETIAGKWRVEFEATCNLAAKLGVGKITVGSGLPGATPDDPNPNWILYPFPARNLERLEWQWSERLIPFWKARAELAEACGVRLCIEMHPANMVFQPSGLLRLRAEVGPALGANVDPSHLTWQGMDIREVIMTLDDAVYHAHAKDTRLNTMVVARQGVLDVKPQSDDRNRSWLFRTVGFGHGQLWWRDYVSALRAVGYDDVLCIEHEDPLIDPLEGLESAVQFLRDCMPTRPRAGTWFE